MRKFGQNQWYLLTGFMACASIGAAQNTEISFDYAAAVLSCSTLDSEICRADVVKALAIVSQNFPNAAGDPELTKLVDALVGGLTEITDIQIYLTTAAMLRLVANQFFNPELVQVVFAIAAIVEQGQPVVLQPNSLLASAN